MAIGAYTSHPDAQIRVSFWLALPCPAFRRVIGLVGEPLRYASRLLPGMAPCHPFPDHVADHASGDHRNTQGLTRRPSIGNSSSTATEMYYIIVSVMLLMTTAPRT